MADYKGKSYSGVVKDGKLELSDGHKFSTPSAAAMHITRTNVNGWRFWRCKLPRAIPSTSLWSVCAETAHASDAAIFAANI